MKTELREISPTLKEAAIEIEAEVVRATYDRVSNLYSKQATIAGFRPGRAPISLIRKKYKNEIESEALERIIDEAVNKIVEANELSVISKPEVKLEEGLGSADFGSNAIRLSAKFEVFPSIELKPYKGLSLTRYTFPIKDEDIDREIERLREFSASLTPVEDRGAQLKDILTIDLHGVYVDAQDKPDIDSEDMEVSLNESILPEIRDALLGAQIDEEREFTIHYAEDYDKKEFAGQTVNYKVKIKTIKVKELPEVDDEWAHSVNENIETLNDLRTLITGELANMSKDASDRRLREQVVDKLIALHDLEVPPSLLAAEMHAILRSILERIAQKDVDSLPPDFDSEAETAMIKAVAERRLRGMMLLMRIAAEEGINISAEEINTELQRIAGTIGKPFNEVHDVLTKGNGKSRIATGLKVNQTFDLVIGHANITEEEWPVEDALDEGGQASDSSDEEKESEQISNVQT